MADLGAVGVSADTQYLFHAFAFYSTTPVSTTGKTVSGTVLSDASVGAIRTVRIYNRNTGAFVGQGFSDASGNYSIAAPNVECNFVVLDDAAGTQYNDRIGRVLPGP
jgi:hypothetical protein